MKNTEFEEFFNSWDPLKIEVWEEDGFFLGQYPQALLPEKLRGFYTVKVEKSKYPNREEAIDAIESKLKLILKSRAGYLNKNKIGKI